jgi:hypothetical protein
MSEHRSGAVDDDDDSFHSASDGEHDDTPESVDDRVSPPVQQHEPAVAAVLLRPTSLSTDSERSPLVARVHDDWLTHDRF